MTIFRSAFTGLSGRGGGSVPATATRCAVCNSDHDGIDPASKEPTEFCSVRCSLHDLLD